MIPASALWTPALLTVAAAIAYSLAAVAAPRLGASAVRAALAAAWALHGLVLAFGLAEQPPRFGFAPALSMTAWLVLTVYAIEHRLYPQLTARWTLAILGAGAVLMAWFYPGVSSAGTNSPWLPLHWALGIASYGLFGAAVVHAWLMTRAERQIRLATSATTGVPLLTLERLTFRFVWAGFFLLTATLVAGWLFGETFSQTPPTRRWDHKTVFSVLSWITFAVLLVGRARFGWRGRTAVRFLYAGATFLLLAYAGSRFVLEVLLGRSP